MMDDSSSNPLDHKLVRHFPELIKADSSDELVRLPIYQEIGSEIDSILNFVWVGNHGKIPEEKQNWIRATAWNIERGIGLEGIIDVLGQHPVIRKSDVLLLTELDYGMARTENRKIASDLAEVLSLNFAFAPSYINLEKGSGLENDIEGSNHQGIHGNAIFSPYPIRDAHSIPLPNGKDKMRGKEKRLGCQRAVAAIIDFPQGPVKVVSAHLDAHSTQKHRMRQMQIILDDMNQFYPDLPALIGGDWNTSTHNSSTALFSILGYCRRVLMGVRHVLKNHYPYPERWFERHLFRELESRGYNYRDLNVPGGCTLHYDVNDMAANGRMADWIPNWCFWFINWALAKNDGKASMKLDWFAGKSIQPLVESPPRIIADVHTPENPLSDHDPIVLDFLISK
jgi:endonuclease/exonuclease/phosphatase family metal-dependent hydrolase